MSGPQLNPGRGTQHELQLELPTRVAGAGRWPVFALKVSLRGLCGGKIYLNGKRTFPVPEYMHTHPGVHICAYPLYLSIFHVSCAVVSNQAVASRAQEVVSIVPVNQWVRSLPLVRHRSLRARRLRQSVNLYFVLCMCVTMT
jgi:hypothetical protein